MKLYFIGNIKQGVVKIGVSKNPAQRAKWLNKNSPYLFTVLGHVSFDGSQEEQRRYAREWEKTLHYQMAEHKLRGEWFALCDPIRVLIIASLAGDEGSFRRLIEHEADSPGDLLKTLRNARPRKETKETPIGVSVGVSRS